VVLDQLRVLGLVCARGGSKGLPGKNLRPLAGHPLIVHSIKALLAWGNADLVLCSTDDPEIATVARAAGASTPWLRPEELARDETPKLDVLRHALTETEANGDAEYDLIVDLQPTSPLRTVADIQATVDALLSSDADNALTVTTAHHNPYFDMVELEENGWARLSKSVPKDVPSRQLAPPVYELNGSVYVYKRAYLTSATSPVGPRTAVHVMPAERSVDIDDLVDFLLAERLVESGLVALPTE